MQRRTHFCFSSEDSLDTVLEAIIHLRPPIPVALSDKLVNVPLTVLFRELVLDSKRAKSFLELVDGLLGASLEAWQIWLGGRDHLNQKDDLRWVLVQGLEASDHTISKSAEAFTFRAA